jgi:hypothetical protein
VRPEFNFILTSDERDKDLFFGPLTETDKFIPIQSHWIMAHIMAEAGVFPSVSQARSNGWNKPIPDGFSDLVAGKLKIRVTIFKEKI